MVMLRSVLVAKMYFIALKPYSDGPNPTRNIYLERKNWVKFASTERLDLPIGTIS